MSVPLTYPMKLALRDIANHSSRYPIGSWIDALHFHQGQLNALERRGLIERRPWNIRLTDEGRAVSLALYRYKGETR